MFCSEFEAFFSWQLLWWEASCVCVASWDAAHSPWLDLSICRHKVVRQHSDIDHSAGCCWCCSTNFSFTRHLVVLMQHPWNTCRCQAGQPGSTLVAPQLLQSLAMQMLRSILSFHWLSMTGWCTWTRYLQKTVMKLKLSKYFVKNLSIIYRNAAVKGPKSHCWIWKQRTLNLNTV